MQVVNNGGGEALIVDSLGRVIVKNYARRVALHEAGHFLVAYLMGLLPKDYTLSGWDAFKRCVQLLTGLMCGCLFFIHMVAYSSMWCCIKLRALMSMHMKTHR